MLSEQVEVRATLRDSVRATHHSASVDSARLAALEDEREALIISRRPGGDLGSTSGGSRYRAPLSTIIL